LIWCPLSAISYYKAINSIVLLVKKAIKYLPELVREKRGGTLPSPGGIMGYTHIKYNT
jgi:hypothetical protein